MITIQVDGGEKAEAAVAAALRQMLRCNGIAANVFRDGKLATVSELVNIRDHDVVAVLIQITTDVAPTTPSQN